MIFENKNLIAALDRLTTDLAIIKAELHKESKVVASLSDDALSEYLYQRNSVYKL